MINKDLEAMILRNERPFFSTDSLVLDVKKVATVREEHTLLHALMLLQTVGYASIPVLDSENRLKGKISIPAIITGVTGEFNYQMERLPERKVSEVINTDVARLPLDFELEDAIKLLNNHNYVCLVDAEGVLRGMITRKEIMSRINYMLHSADRYLDIQKKVKAECLAISMIS